MMSTGTGALGRLVKKVVAAMLARIRGIDLYLCERSAGKQYRLLLHSSWSLGQTTRIATSEQTGLGLV
jgi:hypothetical protein